MRNEIIDEIIKNLLKNPYTPPKPINLLLKNKVPAIQWKSKPILENIFYKITATLNKVKIISKDNPFKIII